MSHTVQELLTLSELLSSPPVFIRDQLRDTCSICRCCWNVVCKWKVHSGRIEIISFVVRSLSPHPKTVKPLNQGFLVAKLKSSLWNFYGRHHDLVNRYGTSVSQMTTGMFRLPKSLTRSRKSQDRQYNDLQNTTQKIEERATRTLIKTGGELKSSERVSSSCTVCDIRRVALVTNSSNSTYIWNIYLSVDPIFQSLWSLSWFPW
jgi:hypothetical protein